MSAVVADVVPCNGVVFTGINGVFNNFPWSDITQDWRVLVGTVDGFDAYLIVNCDSSTDCEVFNMAIAYIDGGGFSVKVYQATFIGTGSGCVDPDQFGDAIPNDNTACGVIFSLNGAEGTVTLSFP